MFVLPCIVVGRGTWSHFPSKLVGVLRGRCCGAVGSGSCNVHEEWRGILCIGVDKINSMVSNDVCKVVLSVVVAVCLCLAIVGD